MKALASDRIGPHSLLSVDLTGAYLRLSQGGKDPATSCHACDQKQLEPGQVLQAQMSAVPQRVDSFSCIHSCLFSPLPLICHHKYPYLRDILRQGTPAQTVVVVFQICCLVYMSLHHWVTQMSSSLSHLLTCPLTFAAVGDVTRLQTHQTAQRDSGAPKRPYPDVPFSASGLLRASVKSRTESCVKPPKSPTSQAARLPSLGFPCRMAY